MPRSRGGGLLRLPSGVWVRGRHNERRFLMATRNFFAGIGGGEVHIELGLLQRLIDMYDILFAAISNGYP